MPASLATLALVVAAGTASAGRESPQPRGPKASANDRILNSRIAAAERRADAAEQRRAAPEAARERAASRAAYRQIGVAKAFRLAQREAGTDRQRPVTPPAGRLRRYVNSHQAVIENRKGEPFLVRSTLPLRDRDRRGRRRPVSTLLRAGDTAIRPVNALADFTVSRSDPGAVRFPRSRFGVRLAGSRDRAPVRVDDDKAFFAEVARDTDLMLVSLPAGVQSIHQLRSPESPERIALEFDLPRGARLVERPLAGGTKRPRSGLQGPEMVEVRRGARRLGSVSPPVAWDAQQRRLPTRVQLAGNRLEIVVAHRSADAAYPIQLDPYVYEDQQWHHQNADFTGWRYSSGPAGREYWVAGMQGTGPYGRGLNLYNYGDYYSPTWYNHADYGQWTFQAPGRWTGTYAAEGAYIYKADFGYVAHVLRDAAGCAVEGLWSQQRGWWEANAVWRGPAVTDPYQSSPSTDCGYENYNYDVHCLNRPCGDDGGDPTNVGTPGNMAVFQYYMNGHGNRYYAKTLYFARALLHMSDRYPPHISHSAPQHWVDDATFRVTGRDYGLGMREVSLSVPSWPAQPAPRATSCPTNNARNARCPEAHSDDYRTADMPEGRITATARAADVLGRAREQSIPLKVDHSPPTYALRGTLAEAQGRTLHGDSYSLGVDAEDGAADEPRSGVATIRFLVDGVEKLRVDQTCPVSQDSCTLSGDRTFTRDEFGPGQHTVRVEITDRANNTDSQEWLVFVPAPVDPQPPVSLGLSEHSQFRIDGAAAEDAAGASVLGIGDVNGDAIADAAVGAPGHDPRGRADAGSVYVVYGRAGGGTFDLAGFDSHAGHGFRIDGAAAGDRIGGALEAVEDVNGDDIGDLVIGSDPEAGTTADPALRRSVWVVFGSATPADVDLASLGSGGFRIDGPLVENREVTLPGGAAERRPRPFGAALGGGPAGGAEVGDLPARTDDVNGDGLSDVVIGSSGEARNLRPNSGSAYVVFGKATTEPVDVEDLGSGGFRIDGAALDDLAGYSVANAGDVNGDELADVAVGSPGHDANGRTGAGAGWVVFGSAETSTVDLAALATRGFRVDGGPDDQLGLSAAAVGDLNNDGHLEPAFAGRAGVIPFGKADAAAVDAAAADARAIRVTSDGSDLEVGEAGDYDADGTNDILFGAPSAEGGAGNAWVVYGEEIPATIALNPLGGHLGVRYAPAAETVRLGTAVDAAGRVAGRNAAGQILAAPGSTANGRSASGSVYLTSGRAIEGCADWYTPEASEEGAIVTCMEGDDTIAIDTNKDGEPDVTRDRPATATAAAADDDNQPSENLKKEKRDTGYRGELIDRNEWEIRRTGVILEINERRVVEIGRTRIYARVNLSGRQSIHKGRMQPDVRISTKPRDFRVCDRTDRRGDCQVNEVFVPAAVYHRGGKGLCFGFADCGADHRRPQTRSHQIGGTFRWQFRWTALIQYIGVQNIDWSRTEPVVGRKFYTAKFRCPRDADDQCLYVKGG